MRVNITNSVGFTPKVEGMVKKKKRLLKKARKVQRGVYNIHLMHVRAMGKCIAAEEKLY